MAKTQIRAEQVYDLTLTNLQIATNAGIELSKLAEAVIQADGGQAFTGDQSMGGNKLTNLATPTQANDAVTKAYADSVASGLDVKESVRVATVENITLSGTQTIDGVSLVAGDRVLVKDQTDASENGIYVVASGVWARSADAIQGLVSSGLFTFVEEGGINDNTGWVLATANPITVGTTDLNFVQFSSAGSYTAGDALSLAGNEFNVQVDGVTISINGSNQLQVNVGAGLDTTNNMLNVKAGSSITVDANGVSVRVDGQTIWDNGSGLELMANAVHASNIDTSAIGAGLTGGNGTAIAISLATNSGLDLTSGLSVDAGHGIKLTANGVEIDLSYYVVREVPTGLKNNSNKNFTLAHTPVLGKEMVYLNGVLMNEGAGNDYTISAGTISFDDAPKSNDTILVTYWY
jgi:hypothetical protein